jgi:hypothetical protein
MSEQDKNYKIRNLFDDQMDNVKKGWEIKVVNSNNSSTESTIEKTSTTIKETN